MKRYVTTLSESNFNSIKVRLELGIYRNNLYRISNFNSIKVRLELEAAIIGIFPVVFQFHKGTIRTPPLKHH